MQRIEERTAAQTDPDQAKMARDLWPESYPIADKIRDQHKPVVSDTFPDPSQMDEQRPADPLADKPLWGPPIIRDTNNAEQALWKQGIDTWTEDTAGTVQSEESELWKRFRADRETHTDNAEQPEQPEQPNHDTLNGTLDRIQARMVHPDQDRSPQAQDQPAADFPDQ